MLGDSGVGKSSLIMRWTLDAFSPSLVSTVGVNFKSKRVVVKGEQLQVQVWDTAGQEQFHKITTSYYKGAHGIMLVYDVSDRKSVESVEYWVKNIKSHASDSVQLALLGNKTDLRAGDSPPPSIPSAPSPSSSPPTASVISSSSLFASTPPHVQPAANKCIPSEYGKDLAFKYGVSFFETSAKDSSNVADAFVTLVEHIVSSASRGRGDFVGVSSSLPSHFGSSSQHQSNIFFQGTGLDKSGSTSSGSGLFGSLHKKNLSSMQSKWTSGTSPKSNPSSPKSRGLTLNDGIASENSNSNDSRSIDEKEKCSIS
jgi:small GTP-binding protein